MEKIYQYTEKLLAYHEYVVVPGLGGFVLQKQSARIFPDRIVPPVSVIGFNPLIQHGDGLLAIEIARSEGITYRKAVELIDNEVSKFKDQLNKGETIGYGNFGKLSKNDKGAICFAPADNARFLPANLCMSDLYIAERDFTDKITVRKPVITFPAARTFRYAAAASLLFGMLLISPKVSDVKRADTAGFLPFDSSSILQSTHRPVADTVAVNPCPELKVTELPDGQIHNNNSELYHVVIASMASQSDAEELCQKLKAENYECAHVLDPSHTFRVAIKSFESRDEAIRYMENLRKQDKRFETAWVLCK